MLIFLFIPIACQFLAAFIIGVYLALQSPEASQTSSVYESYASFILFLSSLITLAIFIFIFRLRKKNMLKICKFNHPFAKDTLVGAFAGFASNFIVSIALLFLTLFSFFDTAFEEYQNLVAPIQSGSFFFSILGIGILAPIIEEILFRGIIMYQLKKLFPIQIVIILQGILFGVYHFNIIQGFYAAFLGIYFGFLAYKSNSIWPAIIAHMMMNITSLVITSPTISNSMEQYTLIPILYFLLSLYLFCYSLIYFVKKKSPQDALNEIPLEQTPLERTSFQQTSLEQIPHEQSSYVQISLDLTSLEQIPNTADAQAIDNHTAGDPPTAQTPMADDQSKAPPAI